MIDREAPTIPGMCCAQCSEGQGKHCECSLNATRSIVGLPPIQSRGHTDFGALIARHRELGFGWFRSFARALWAWL